MIRSLKRLTDSNLKFSSFKMSYKSKILLSKCKRRISINEIVKLSSWGRKWRFWSSWMKICKEKWKVRNIWKLLRQLQISFIIEVKSLMIQTLCLQTGHVLLASLQVEKMKLFLLSFRNSQIVQLQKNSLNLFQIWSEIKRTSNNRYNLSKIYKNWSLTLILLDDSQLKNHQNQKISGDSSNTCVQNSWNLRRKDSMKFKQLSSNSNFKT